MALKDVGANLIVEGLSSFESGMARAKGAMTGLKNTIASHSRAIGLAMTAAGGAILAAGAMAVKTYAEMGDEIAKVAKRTGMSTEFISEWRHVAELSGTNIEVVEMAIKRMSIAIVDATTGLGESSDAFWALGLSVSDLMAMSPEQQFNTIADALSRVESETVQASLAQQLFGRMGTQLLPAIEMGSEALAEMRQEAHDLGIVFDAEGAAKAEAMADAMKNLTASITGLMFEAAIPLINVLKPLLLEITRVIKGIIDWTSQHPALSEAIVLVTMGIGGLLAAGGVLILMLPGLSALAGLLGVTLGTLVIPIAAVIAAIGLLVAAGYLLWKNWDTVGPALKTIWEGIKTVAITVFKGLASIILMPIKTVLEFIDSVLARMPGVIASKIPGFRDIQAMIAAANAEIGKVAAFQFGGMMARPGLAMVGERGPEMVSLPPGAMVSPTTNTYNYNVSANYTQRQEPQGIRLDLEALLLMTRG